jgi:hypothetical protein
MDNEPKERNVGVDTSLVFPMIRSAVQTAECKLIDGKRCFVVSENVYLKIMSYLFVSSHEVRFDPRIATEGYDNVLISLSARDAHEYYLCAKLDSLLDKVWEAKTPKQLSAS